MKTGVRKIVVLSFLLLFMSATAGFAATTELVSKSSNGEQGNAMTPDFSGISDDGRFIAFISLATNLVPGDTNGLGDLFVHDRQTGTTERIVSAEDAVHYFYGNPTISADGRYVAFASLARNLVPNDTNNVADLFVYDRQTSSVERVSVNNSGVEGNGQSGPNPSISADGRYVAFRSRATNLVPSGGISGAFVYDRLLRTIEQINVGNCYVFFPNLSSDGRYVVFSTTYTYGHIDCIPGDTNDTSDTFLYDRTTGILELISIASDGTQGNSRSSDSNSVAVSADGRYVVFDSTASNLDPRDQNGNSDIFIRDRVAGTTEMVGVSSAGIAGGGSTNASMSKNGRYITFSSEASNLVEGDTNNKRDIFLHDMKTGVTERISVDALGNQANNSSMCGATISSDGSFVVFPSSASNLVPNDTNQAYDLFVRSRQSTLAVTNGSYDYINDRLTVKASSGHGEADYLELENYGPLTWNPATYLWEIVAENVQTPPLSINICGFDGCITR